MRSPLLAPDIQNHPFGWFFVLNSWCVCRMIGKMKCFRLAFLLVASMPMLSRANATTGATEITMTTTQAIQLAGRLVQSGDTEHATQILTMMPDTGNAELETERQFLLAQIASRRGDIDGAIRIYQKILDARPDAARVRFELALCYMHQGRWSRADYHLRLAMAGDDLSDDAKRMMNYYRYVVRQNKNWNVYFNFGAAPDNNVNNATGGDECLMTIFGPFCRKLSEPESAVGANFQLGGDYEFKLSDQWRWKSDASIYTNIYDKHDYDDLYLTAGTGPRYLWSRGDVARNTAINDAYAYWQPNVAIGIGAELPWGFSVYGEPSVYWTRYDDGLYTAHNGAWTKITAHDFTHRYSLSVSNNKLDVWGFVPTLTVSYTQRDSNLWQREFKKTAIEFTMMQRF